MAHSYVGSPSAPNCAGGRVLSAQSGCLKLFRSDTGAICATQSTMLFSVRQIVSGACIAKTIWQPQTEETDSMAVSHRSNSICRFTNRGWEGAESGPKMVPTVVTSWCQYWCHTARIDLHRSASICTETDRDGAGEGAPRNATSSERVGAYGLCRKDLQRSMTSTRGGT